MILTDICTILKDYMGLDGNHVWIRDEKLNKTKNATFSIVVGFFGLKPYGNSQRQIMSTSTTMSEEISTNMGGQVVIDIEGRTFDVMTRKEEIVQAMKSTACKELQIKNGFLIGEIPTSMNKVPDVDGAAIPYHFQLTFNVQFMVKKSKIIEYYDTYRLDNILTEG